MKEVYWEHLGKGLPLCSGSRNHGCQGCFCRKLSTTKSMGKCDQCGKFVYDLMDQLWNIRQFSGIFKDIYFRPYMIQLVIASAVHLSMRNINFGVLSRSKLMELYTEATILSTNSIVPLLATRAMQNRFDKGDKNLLDLTWWYDSTFPLDIGDLLGYRDSEFFVKYKYHLMRCIC